MKSHNNRRKAAPLSQIFYRRLRSKHLIQIIPTAWWFRCNDVMFDPFQLPRGWRHSRDVEAVHLSTFARRDSPIRTRLVFFPMCSVDAAAWRGACVSLNTPARHRRMEVDPPATTSTCCLPNADVALGRERMWHCDIKECHSSDVRSFFH